MMRSYYCDTNSLIHHRHPVVVHILHSTHLFFICRLFQTRMASRSVKVITLILVLAINHASAFVVRPNYARTSTVLFLEDWVADMIDQELLREKNKQDYEKKWMEQNRKQILQHVPTFVDDGEDDLHNFRQYAKDKKLARQDPERYCADRCIATGNCDVYEDIFQLSPEQVLSFCNDCVLSQDKEECELPDAFYDSLGEDEKNNNKPLP